MIIWHLPCSMNVSIISLNQMMETMVSDKTHTVYSIFVLLYILMSHNESILTNTPWIGSKYGNDWANIVWICDLLKILSFEMNQNKIKLCFGFFHISPHSLFNKPSVSYIYIRIWRGWWICIFNKCNTKYTKSYWKQYPFNKHLHQINSTKSIDYYVVSFCKNWSEFK